MASFLSVFFVIVAAFSIHAQNYNDVQRLLNELFRHYNPNIKPVFRQTVDIQVDVNLYILSIYQLEEKSQTVTGDVYWDIRWTDEMFKWNETDYNGIDHIYVPTDNIWMPDIVVSNGVGPSKFLDNNFRTDHVSILADGTVGWWPTGDVTIQCDVVLTKFPFDKQDCFFEIEQWYMDRSDMVLLTSTSGPSLEYYRLNDEWDISGTNFETDMYKDDFGNYSAVKFNIRMQRRPSFYIITMLLPVLLLSFLNSCCFLLPPESGEKIGLSISMFLTFILLLTIVTSDMPSTSRNIFMFEIVIGINLFSSGIDLVLSILIVKAYVYNTSYFSRIIDRIKCRKPKFACCHRSTVKTFESGSTQVDIPYATSEVKDIECHNVGKVFARNLDIFLFKLTFLVNVALTCGFLATVIC